MCLTLESEREDDGRFLDEVPDLPGVLAYGETQEQAVARAQALALRVLALESLHQRPHPTFIPHVHHSRLTTAHHLAVRR